MKTRHPPSGSSSPREGTERSSSQSHHNHHHHSNHNDHQHHNNHLQDHELETQPERDLSHAPNQSRSQKPWHRSRTLLTIFSTTIALALLGMGIKLSIKYTDTPLIHVSVAVVVFTAVASIVWSLFECLAATCACAFSGGGIRRRRLYPGAHVGVHMCLCLACVAAVGYVCIWVSHGYQWRYVEDELEEEEGRRQVEVDGLYRMGIVVVVLTGMLLLIHFVQAMLACQEIRRKEDGNEVERIPVVTVRYDGVGPVGTARPGGWRVQENGIFLPVYQTQREFGSGGRRSNEPPLRSPPVVIARGDLGVEIVESSPGSMERVMTPPPVLEKPSRSGVGSEKTLVN
ncbi:hypothetical protein QBC44DRAFT_292206 [Cladorrhinum sp. PSN332]|nr:hypothetical protein QBC44DRAFT_292206 [Cladorrhinum sp. PSN332]